MPPHAFVDFSANINVLAPVLSPCDWEAWRKDVLRYPEADASGVRRRLASVYRVNADEIVPTAGAIEALYLAARLFDGCKTAIIEPAFGDYSRAFEAASGDPARIPLAREWWHAPVSEWAHLIEPFDVIVMGNPNNPTGSLKSRVELCRLLARQWDRPKCWIVDEAFIEFVADCGRETLLPVLDKHPSLIVLRSLTKSWAIPGLRLGFLATSNPDWLAQLRRMQPPWSINSVTEAWAASALNPGNHARLLAGLHELREAGLRFAGRLQQIGGLLVCPSACNFLLVEITEPSLDARSIYQALGRRGLLVRVCDSFYGMPAGRFIRVAVRSEAENNRLAEELETICAGAVRKAA
jgi:threonine-phosphate decarboxylase